MGYLVIFSVLFIVYSYFGYPLLLLLLPGRKVKKSCETGSYDVPFTVIITVRNEQAVLARKIEATLALCYRGRLLEELLVEENPRAQLIVASDASDDGTDGIAEAFASRGVELVRLPSRKGKESAQREAVTHARGEVIIFTDAKIELSTNALERFVDYFADAEIGAVSSRDVVLASDGSSSGEGFYVRYEMFLRRLESSYYSIVGLSGSCFAVRRNVAQRLAVTVPSDFALLLEAVRLGFRGVHAEDIVGAYRAVKSEREEFSRKVRTVLRGMTTLFSHLEVMNPFRFGCFSWQVISHKLCRWLVPWFFALATLGTLCLAHSGVLWTIFAFLFVCFYSLALLGALHPNLGDKTLFKVPLFFLVVNLAIAVAWVNYLSGKRAVTWEPSKKVES